MKYVKVVNMIFKNRWILEGKKHWIWVEKTFFFIRTPVRWWPHWPWPQRNGKRSMNGWKQVSRPTSACIVSRVSHIFMQHVVFSRETYCDFTGFYNISHISHTVGLSDIGPVFGKSEKSVRSLITLYKCIGHSFFPFISIYHYNKQYPIRLVKWVTNTLWFFSRNVLVTHYNKHFSGVPWCTRFF